MKPNHTIGSEDWMLVVDDQDEFWQLLQLNLKQRLAARQLVRASSVITALSLLQTCLMNQQPLPRLILVDLYLPRREDGFHLLGALKSNASGLSHLPVVIISSSTDPSDQQAMRQQGAPYLVKPTQHWHEFLNQLQRYWGRAVSLAKDY
jgi:CheY-like chemotaxis protein